MKANSPQTNAPDKKTFSLIETMLWENGSLFLLDLHIKRLSESASFFGFPFDKTMIINKLQEITSGMNKTKRYKVRLLSEKSGNIKIDRAELALLPPGQLKAAVSNKKVDSSDGFLRHKTTNRALYDDELSLYRPAGFFDVLFLNEKNELAEGSITNVIVKKGNEYLTPPLECGLLNGVYRQFLINTGELGLKEKVLRADDLYSADEVLLINSVRKAVPVTVSRYR